LFRPLCILQQCLTSSSQGIDARARERNEPSRGLLKLRRKAAAAAKSRGIFALKLEVKKTREKLPLLSIITHHARTLATASRSSSEAVSIFSFSYLSRKQLTLLRMRYDTTMLRRMTALCLRCSSLRLQRYLSIAEQF